MTKGVEQVRFRDSSKTLMLKLVSYWTDDKKEVIEDKYALNPSWR